MSVQFHNFDYRYQRKGKPVFAPSKLGRAIGKDIKAQVRAAVEFDPFYFHLRDGGHVASLHRHREHRFFARIDIERFFYGISRNRVARALTESGIPRAANYAKWSSVKNPYNEPSYVLPYGFIQSPILASLVLMKSAVGSYLREVHNANDVTVSVYMDDISFSSDDLLVLTRTFEETLERLSEAQFGVNQEKIRAPGPGMDLFNCDLERGRSAVQDTRVAAFFATPHSNESEEAFIQYCASVEIGNT